MPYRSTVLFQVRNYLTGPSMPVVIAVGGKGSTTGVPFPGVTCNELHVDLTAPAVLFTERGGWNGSVTVTLRYLPYRSAYANLPIWVQSAWSYRNTGPLMLSQGSTIRIPPKPPDSPRRTVLYDSDPNADWGVGPYANYYMHGVARFRR